MKKLKFCNLCGQNKFELLFKSKDKMFDIPGEYSVMKCKNCGLIFINPQPNNKEISSHYPKAYYSIKENALEESKLRLYKIFYSSGNQLKKFIFYPLSPFVRGIKIVKGGNYLDVGCGDGKFLSIVKEKEMRCFGVDPFGKQKTEKDLIIRDCGLKEANFKANFFDVITLNHVLEHIENPLETLKEIHRVLKPNGTLIIATPNVDSLTSKIFGKYWFQLDSPRHLFLYSEKTIRKYALKNQFDISHIRYNSTPFQFLGSFLYLLNSFRKKPVYPNDSRILNSKLMFLLFLPISYIFNALHLGDQFEVVLKKR